MNPIESIAEDLKRIWGGKTLATLRSDAQKQMNGTEFQAMRAGSGPRCILAICITGQYELQRFKGLSEEGAEDFGDWSQVSLIEAIARAAMREGFAYAIDQSGPAGARPIVLLAMAPDKIMALEKAFKI